MKIVLVGASCLFVSMYSMETKSDVTLLRDLCVTKIVGYLSKEPEKLLTRIHNRASHDNVIAALNVLPFECASHLATHIPIFPRPDLNDLQDINDNDGIIRYGWGKVFRMSDPSKKMGFPDMILHKVKLSSTAKYAVMQMKSQDQLWISSPKIEIS